MHTLINISVVRYKLAILNLFRYFNRSMFLGLLSFFFVGLANAQDLINSGQINSTGTIRVKNQALGLPASIDGVFEFFGANQQVPARQYRNLLLTGSGTKTTVGGNSRVTDTLTIASAIRLRVPPSAVLTLNGTLVEQGYLAGRIQKSLDLSGSTTSSNFGNIGVTISWSGTAPGLTTVTRGSDTILTGNGYQSIKRYYDIVPTTNSGLNANLVFRYSDNELNGQDPMSLSLWRSVDGGSTWRKQGGIVDPVAKTITKSGVFSFSLWTASDADHPLGPPDIENPNSNPGRVALASGNYQSGVISTALPYPFVVIVTDADGNPIQGVNVTFAITSTPYGATGHSLGATNALTGINGQASTILTPGNKVGAYIVTATAAGLTGSPVTFTATATAGAPTTIALTSGNHQSGVINTTFSYPFVVTVRDSGGNPVGGVSVEFAIANVPSGATGQRLSVENATTDANGEATTTLTLGDKVGFYTVLTRSKGLAGDPVTLTGTATAGTAARIALASGNNQTGVIKTILSEPFAVTVMDEGGNPVQGANVTFAIASTPNGATGESLSVTNIATDVNGSARTLLTLGNKVGIYSVNATALGFTQSAVTFTASAIAGAPAAIALVSGNNQSGETNSTLPNPFVVVVADEGGNVVQGASVTFVMEGAPSGASGQSLSVSHALTDTNGQASTVLTLGDKLGTYTVTAASAGLAGSPVTFTATATSVTTVDLVASTPKEFELFQNYPNPFNPMTEIRFAIPKESKVQLLIFDIIGRPVRTLVDNVLLAGTYKVNWDSRDESGMSVATGVYLYRLIADGPSGSFRNGFAQTKKMVLTK